jgi:hypothetical protein
MNLFKLFERERERGAMGAMAIMRTKYRPIVLLTQLVYNTRMHVCEREHC